MAAPAHYIRTIHTSFTAAHNAASVRTQHHQYLHPFTSSSINSHNSQIYQQHLHQQPQQQHHHQQQYLQTRRSATSITGTPSPAGAGGRRRAGSVRMAPSCPSSPVNMKFDPFADEPPTGLSSYPLTPSSQVNRFSYIQNPTYNNRDYHHHQQPASITSSGSASSASSTPITIHIPAAAPTEIKRYSASPGRRIADFGSSSAARGGGGGGGGNSSTFLGGSTIPSAVPNLNPSKIVAGILLNRVHAVGKPMRRRMPGLAGPKQYVKSGLSSVVSVEA